MSGARVVRLDRRPVGVPEPSTWRIEDIDIPALGERQFLVQTELVSLDPAMRGWLDDRPSYLPPVAVGDVMRANAVGVVVESRHPRFPVGTRVQGLFGVQTHVVSDGRGVTVVDESLGTPAMYLGVLGNTGLTAYFGLFHYGRPRAGDTVVVSAAAGAVGSIVGQLARIAGCRTVGLAGGPEKCEMLTGDLGYDHAIDYRSADLRTAFAEHCPRGIDVYFDNVGGPILNAALANLAHGGRVVICGAISQYNATEAMSGPSNYWRLLMSRGTMTGFLVFDHAAEYPVARQRLADWVADGRIVAPDTVVPGRIDDFHDTFLRLFSGDNVGKLILDISAGS
jgi:NADPH-dependent curcumin reductase CurA